MTFTKDGDGLYPAVYLWIMTWIYTVAFSSDISPRSPPPPTSPHLTPTALAVVLSLFFPSHFSQCLTRGFCFVCFLIVIIWLFSAYRHDRRHRSSITLRSPSMHSDRVGRRTQWTYSIVSFAIPVVGVLIPNGFDAVLCPSVFNWAQHTSVCWFVWLELF